MGNKKQRRQREQEEAEKNDNNGGKDGQKVPLNSAASSNNNNTSSKNASFLSSYSSAAAFATVQENRPQLSFTLQRARKSSITPRDLGTLVCQAMLPFENPNYLVLDPSSQWFQLQHQRDIPAVVVISVPGLPEEVILSEKNEYFQPARLIPTNATTTTTATATDAGAKTEQATEKPTENDAASNNKDGDNNKSTTDEAQEEEEISLPSSIPNVFPAGVNPWLRHIRMDLAKSNQTMNFGKMWLQHQQQQSTQGGMFIDDPNVALEFFFRMKSGGGGHRNPLNNNNNQQQQPQPSKLGDVISLLKNKNMASATPATEDSAAVEEESNKNTKEEVSKELSELWNPLRKLPEAAPPKTSNSNSNKNKSNGPPVPTILSEIALDVDGLRALGFPFETDASYSHPEPRDMNTVNAGNETNNNNNKNNANANATSGFINFEKQAAQNDSLTTKKKNANDDSSEQEQDEEREGKKKIDEKNSNEKEGNNGLTYRLAQDSKVVPLPEYEKLFPLEKQRACLKYLRQKMTATNNNFDDPALDSPLKARLDLLAIQLKNDIAITKGKTNRIQVSTPGLFSQIAASSQAEDDSAAASNNINTHHYATLAMDCEMILTSGWGSTLSRLTLIDCPSGDVVIDVMVKPTNRVFDYVSRYSGIGASDLEGIELTFDSARLLCQCLMSRNDTYVVGHSLENDYIVCRLLADAGAIVDTAYLYPNPRGLPYRNALKYLAFTYLNGRSVQNGVSGHCSAEDARTAMDLISLKLANGKDFGMPNRVNILTWLCPNPLSSETTTTATTSASSSSSSPNFNCHLLEKPFIMKKICTGGADAISTANDGTVSHRAEKLLKRSTKDNIINNNNNNKTFIWAQLYDAPLRQCEEEELEKLMASEDNSKQEQIPESTTDEDAAAAAAAATNESLAEEKTQAPKTVKEFLKSHVTAVHRRIHRIVNAAPDKTLFVVMGFAYPNTVSEQARHPSHHGAVFSWVKDARTDPKLPEGDDMYDALGSEKTADECAVSGEGDVKKEEIPKHLQTAAAWGGQQQ